MNIRAKLVHVARIFARFLESRNTRRKKKDVSTKSLSWDWIDDADEIIIFRIDSSHAISIVVHENKTERGWVGPEGVQRWDDFSKEEIFHILLASRRERRRIWKLSRDRSRLRSRNPGENLKCKKRKREVDASVGFPAVVATILGRLVDDEPLHGWSSAIFQTRRFGGSPSSTTLTNSPRFPAPFYIGKRKGCVSTDLSHLRFTLFSSNFPNSSIVESKSLHHFLAWS